MANISGFVLPIAVVAKTPTGGWAFMNVSNGQLQFSSSGPVVETGEPTPQGYVQPYALVAQDSNGNWQYLNVDSSGRLKVTT